VAIALPTAIVPEPAELSDGLVRLRPYRADDVEPMYLAARESLAEVSPWMAWCHADHGIDDSRRWVQSRESDWKAGEEYSFVVVDATGGAPVGACGLNKFDHINRRANLGYWIRTSETGRGLATAAARLLARWGFERVGLTRIEIVAAVGNFASQRVATKLGAVHEGVLRNRCFLADGPRDAHSYSLIPGDL